MQTGPQSPSRLSFAIRRISQQPFLLALIYLAFITLAESITTLSTSVVGLALHGVVLVLMLVHGAVVEDEPVQRFLYSLALMPLIRLMSLSLPLVKFPFVTWFMVVGAPLLVATFFAARAINVSPTQIGFRMRWRELPVQLLIGLTGIGLGFMEYKILQPDPLIPALSVGAIVLPGLILLFFTGLLEEVIFRGLLQTTTRDMVGKFSLVYVSVLFAVMHIGYKSILDLLFVFSVAMFFGMCVQRTGSLYGVTLAHGFTNIGLFLVFPFLAGAAPVVLTGNSEPVDLPALTWSADLSFLDAMQSAASGVWSGKAVQIMPGRGIFTRYENESAHPVRQTRFFLGAPGCEALGKRQRPRYLLAGNEPGNASLHQALLVVCWTYQGANDSPSTL